MKERSLKKELNDIYFQAQRLEERRKEIYKESLESPESEKVCEDRVARLISIDKPIPTTEYPIAVTGINLRSRKPIPREDPGPVMITPCGSTKEYTGFLVGEFPVGLSAVFNRGTGVISIEDGYPNPAIYVPDLKKIVMGYESWWRKISEGEKTNDSNLSTPH